LQANPLSRLPAQTPAPQRVADDDLTDFSSSLASGTLFMSQFLKPLDASFSGNDSAVDSSFSSIASSNSSFASSVDDVSASMLAEMVAKTRAEDVQTDEHGKPRISMVCLVAMSIVDSTLNRRTLTEIFDWLEAKFPYFDPNDGFGWKQSVRCCLSQSKHFIKQHSLLMKNADASSKVIFWRLRSESGGNNESSSQQRKQRSHADSILAPDRPRKVAPPRRHLPMPRRIPLDAKDQMMAASPDAVEGASVLLQFSGSMDRMEGVDRRVRGGYTPSAQTAATTHHPLTSVSFLPPATQLSSQFSPFPPQSLPPIARSLAHSRQATTGLPSRTFQVDADHSTNTLKPRFQSSLDHNDDSKMRTSPDVFRSSLEAPVSMESTPLFIFSSPLSVQGVHPAARRRLVPGMDIDDDSAAAALLSLAVTPSHK